VRLTDEPGDGYRCDADCETQGQRADLVDAGIVRQDIDDAEASMMRPIVSGKSTALVKSSATICMSSLSASAVFRSFVPRLTSRMVA